MYWGWGGRICIVDDVAMVSLFGLRFFSMDGKVWDIKVGADISCVA